MNKRIIITIHIHIFMILTNDRRVLQSTFNLPHNSMYARWHSSPCETWNMCASPSLLPTPTPTPSFCSVLPSLTYFRLVKRKGERERKEKHQQWPQQMMQSCHYQLPRFISFPCWFSSSTQISLFRYISCPFCCCCFSRSF